LRFVVVRSTEAVRFLAHLRSAFSLRGLGEIISQRLSAVSLSSETGSLSLAAATGNSLVSLEPVSCTNHFPDVVSVRRKFTLMRSDAFATTLWTLGATTFFALVQPLFGLGCNRFLASGATALLASRVQRSSPWSI
jgi:hypothetical protein